MAKVIMTFNDGKNGIVDYTITCVPEMPFNDSLKTPAQKQVMEFFEVYGKYCERKDENAENT